MSLQANDDRQTTRARVFISYKHANPDQDLALNIYEGLRQRFDVFIDRRISVGAHWARQINKELERADFFVVLLSEQSIQSEMVIGEIDFARDLAAERGEKRPRILPVRVAYNDRLPYPLSAYFRYVQWIEWHGSNDTPGVVEQLMEGMRSRREDAGRHGDAPVAHLSPGNQDAQGLPLLPGAWMPIDWPPPKGALPSGSPYYIERSFESNLYSLIRQEGVTMSIYGPRQVGKTSLLARLMDAAREHNEADAACEHKKKVVWIDFQLFEKSAFTDIRTFYQQLCGRISVELGLDPQIERHWDDNLGNGHNLDLYVRDYVLPQMQEKAREQGLKKQAIVLAMDEVERVLEAPFRSEFFGILRSWHDRRSQIDILRQLDMVLVASTEPNLWIPDSNRSPFSVGERTNLGDFTEEEVRELNRRYGLPLRDDQMQRLIDLVRGHPYLVHFAIYSIANRNYDAEHLFERAPNADGPFADHLNYLLFRLYGKPELLKALRCIIRRETCRDDNMYDRLHGAGLVRRDDDRRRGHVLPSRRLYADYFHDRLKPTAPWQTWPIFNKYC